MLQKTEHGSVTILPCHNSVEWSFSATSVVRPFVWLSHSQDIHANTGVLSVLPHTFHVTQTSDVHWHQKREYTCVFDSVSFTEILVMINLYYLVWSYGYPVFIYLVIQIRSYDPCFNLCCAPLFVKPSVASVCWAFLCELAVGDVVRASLVYDRNSAKSSRNFSNKLGI